MFEVARFFGNLKVVPMTLQLEGLVVWLVSHGPCSGMVTADYQTMERVPWVLGVLVSIDLTICWDIYFFLSFSE